ncbi:MAG: RNA polymerase sigma factor [Gemmatimonadetes bacterium]|nr:RNA polymerase sigma factor [Gemmatimonadota bacterium]
MMDATLVNAPDGELVARTRTGDGRAFDALVRRHFRMVYMIALGVLGNRMDAEDCAQDAFLRALTAIDQCHSPERVGAWLGMIARNTARNSYAARVVRDADSLDASHPSADTAPSPHHHAVVGELRDRLESALATLTETQRTVVLLHDLHGSPHADIARLLGISEVASRQTLFVARRVLRERLGAHTLTEFLHER